MIDRHLQKTLVQRLNKRPVVALLGSRQVGKTTLARNLSLEKPTQYLDLERPSDLAKLADPELYLSKFARHLVILDEIQRFPELFPVLRSLVDERRRDGEQAGHFLILGSASPDLLQQSSETLAGRISYLELHPVNLTELDTQPSDIEHHWFRGGYPESVLAQDDADSNLWCNDFITSYLESDLPRLGVAATPQLLRRLSSMLAYQQGTTLNLSKIGGSLGIDGKTVRHYVELLEGLYLVRSIPAWSRNAGKRLVRAPKIYWRDTGILHALAGLQDIEQVLGHPICGHSWEGYCIEQILALVPSGTRFSHYRTHAGAEVDLVLEEPSGKTIAVEIKRTLSPRINRGFTESMRTLEAECGVFLMPRGASFALSDTVSAMSLSEFAGNLASGHVL